MYTKIIAGYERDLTSNLPQLQYLDGRDRLGNTKSESDTNVPGKKCRFANKISHVLMKYQRN